MSTLCELAEKYGVDKCPKVFHSYTPKYERILKPTISDTNFVIEIGIGTYEIMSGIVGKHYKHGASLRMWRDYFPNAFIVGLDINPNVMIKDEERIHTLLLDQSSDEHLKNFVDYFLDNKEYADLIIDDGSHNPEHMILSFRYLWNMIRPNGGIYIIEDILRDHLEYFSSLPETLNIPEMEVIYSHPGENIHDSFVAYRRK